MHLPGTGREAGERDRPPFLEALPVVVVTSDVTGVVIGAVMSALSSPGKITRREKSPLQVK